MDIQNYFSYFYVAVGGALGSVLRVYIGSILTNNSYGYIFFNQFPLPIVIVNILGCFLMGVCTELMGVYIPTSYNIRLFLISGLLGGFTTFSAFSLEFGLLWQKNLYLIAVSYALVSFICSIIAFFIGLKVIKLIF